MNILTNHAVNNKIAVFSGTQLQLNLHVQDMCALYQYIVRNIVRKCLIKKFQVKLLTWNTKINQ